MATYELIALDESTPQLLAPTSSDTALIAGNLQVNGTITGATTTSFGTLALGSGSITDSGGSISFGDENLSTTGTLASGALGVTGNITVSGTVDGRDVATDGTKLDGIEALADVTDETNVVAALNGASLSTVVGDSADKVVIQDNSDSDNLKVVSYSELASQGGGGASRTKAIQYSMGYV